MISLCPPHLQHQTIAYFLSDLYFLSSCKVFSVDISAYSFFNVRQYYCTVIMNTLIGLHLSLIHISLVHTDQNHINWSNTKRGLTEPFTCHTLSQFYSCFMFSFFFYSVFLFSLVHRLFNKGRIVGMLKHVFGIMGHILCLHSHT